MARKQPVKQVEKQEVEPIEENNEPILGPIIDFLVEKKEVFEVPVSNVNFSINPSLLEKMLKIGDGAYWNRVLENFVGDLNRRYRS